MFVHFISFIAGMRPLVLVFYAGWDRIYGYQLYQSIQAVIMAAGRPLVSVEIRLLHNQFLKLIILRRLTWKKLKIGS